MRLSLLGLLVAASVAGAQSEAAAAARFDAIRNDSAKLMDFLRAMPKGGDLHNHLGGAIAAESWARWAAEDGLCYVPQATSLRPPPCNVDGRVPATKLMSDSALRAGAIDAWTMRNWRPGGAESGADHFFATFAKTGPVGGSRLGDELAEVASRAAAHQVSYLELMANSDDGSVARLGLKLGWDDDFDRMRTRLLEAGVRDSLRAASRNIERGEGKERELLRCGTPEADSGCNVTIRYIYQVTRSRAPEQVFAQILAGFELPAIDHRVVSFNLVAPEHGSVAMRDFALHMRMIDWLHAKYPNVPITLHAGELSEQVTSRDAMRSHVRQSVEVGHAARIGHGVDVLQEDDSESLLREMASRHVLVEIALTSNDVILGVRGPAHPLSAYLAHGVPVAIATDDAGVSLTDWTREFYRAAAEQHADYRALKTMALNSIEYSFAEDSVRNRLRRQLDSAFVRFERR